MNGVAQKRIFQASTLMLAVMMISIASACGGSEDTSGAEAFAEYERGVTLQEQGNLARALEAYNAALSINPRLVEAYAERGFIYISYDNWNLALANLNRAIELDPDLAKAYNYRGMVFDSLQDSENALRNFRDGGGVAGKWQQQNEQHQRHRH